MLHTSYQSYKRTKYYKHERRPTTIYIAADTTCTDECRCRATEYCCSSQCQSESLISCKHSSLDLMFVSYIRIAAKPWIRLFLGDKMLSCRRETARCFVLLNILLCHSRSLKVIRNDTVLTRVMACDISNVSVINSRSQLNAELTYAA